MLVGMLGDVVATRLGRFNQFAVLGVRPKEIELSDESAEQDFKVYSQIKN